MKPTINKLLTIIIVIITSWTVPTACEVLNSDQMDNVLSPIDSQIRLRSDIGELEKGEYDVTLRMAELFIAADKDNPQVVSIEPYEIDGITCFYIFNFENGYKVVSADTRVQPILAESTEENLYLGEMDNDGIKVWLEDTADRIRVLKVNSIKTKNDYSVFWSNFIDNSSSSKTRSLDPDQDSLWIKIVDLSSNPYTINAHVLPLTSTMWGQGSPWNANMPIIGNDHCITGCVAVAIAQILYYFHVKDGYPNDLWHNISISSFNPDNTVTLSKTNHVTNSSRWINMPLVPLGSNTSYVSDLMLDIGERVNMHYGTSNSSVYLNPNYSIPNLSQCGISSSFGSYNFSTVENNLNNDKPVIVTASDNQYIFDGHTWVIDGCEDYVLRTVETITYRYVAVEDILNYNNVVASYSNDDMLYMYPNAYDGMQEVNINYRDIKQLRMNWGYNGIGNTGYYEVLDSSDWINPYNNNFKYSKVIHYNISTSALN